MKTNRSPRRSRSFLFLPVAVTAARTLWTLAPLAPLAPLAAQEAPRAGTVAGVVTDRTTQQPLAGVTVRVDGAPASASTNEQGRFTLAAVPVGTHVLRLTRIGYAPAARADVAVSAGRTTPLTFAMDAVASPLAVVRVAAPVFARAPDVPTTSYGLSYEEIRRSPGAIGDVSRLVQSLPGVVTANDQRNDIIARGGSPVENLTLVDNVEVPNLNHFAAQNTTGGPISMLNNELVERATFLAGGFPSQFGNRLSSVLDVTLRDGNRDHLEWELDVSFAGAGLIVEGPLAGRGSWMASARQSYLALVAGPFGIEAIPSTSDYQLKATYDLSARDRLWLVSLGGRDAIDFDVDESDLDNPSLENEDNRGWRTVTGVNWQRLLGDRGYGVLSVADAYGAFRVDVHDRRLDDQLTYRNRSGEGETTVKYDLTYRADAFGTVKAGASTKTFRNRFAIVRPLGGRNPYSVDSTRVNAVDIDRDFTAQLHAAYAQLARPLGRHADVTLGARVDRFGSLDATTVSPRAGLVVHLTPTLDLTASYGRYHQQPSLVYQAAHPTNGELDPMRADHYVAGLAFIPRSDLKVTVEAFQKDYARYPVSTQYPTLSLANVSDVGLQGLLIPLTSRGAGRARGAELYVQKKLTGSAYGQVGYTYSRTEHAALDGVRRRGGFDAPHVASLIAGYKPGAAWELSARFSYASGRPYTPVLLAESVEQNRLIYDLTRVNARRAPAYHRLDARADRRFSLRGTNTTLFLEVQNVYDRENVFRYVWNPKTGALHAQKQISFLPIVGVNVEF